MAAVRYARLIVGTVLALSPLACAAQDAPASSTGAVAESAGSGAALSARLDAVAEGAMAPEDLGPTDAAALSWATETKRYAERAADLRGRCREEIRNANRDTVVQRSGQCLRGDLTLEIAHRRKQREWLAAWNGADADVAEAADVGIEAWIDAATAVVDGVDAGVFSTVDTLRQAKRNLHDTYRAPMFAAFARTRSSHLLAATRTLAASVRGALEEEQHAMLGTFVPCVERARDAFAAGEASTGGAADLRAGIAELRACVTLATDAAR